MSKPQAGRRRGAGSATMMRTRQRAPQSPSARDVARQAAYCARGWAAPRLERAGHTLENRVAPKVSGMLYGTARRLEPPRPARRRWPYLAAGLAVAGGVTAAALWRRHQRRTAPWVPAAEEPADISSAASASQHTASKGTPSKAASTNGRVPVA